MQLKTSLLHGIFSSHSLALHILKPTTFVRVQNLKNMITVVVIRTPKGDKKCKRSCQSKNPRKAHSSFWSREFSGVNDLFVQEVRASQLTDFCVCMFGWCLLDEGMKQRDVGIWALDLCCDVPPSGLQSSKIPRLRAFYYRVTCLQSLPL